LIKYITQCNCAVSSYGWWQCRGRDLEGIADVAIKHVVDRALDVDARFVVILIAIKFSGDADCLLASVGDLGDAVSVVDLGSFWYIQSRPLTGLE
jgi:hypothetical protein